MMAEAAHSFVVDYRPEWVTRFEEERARLAEVFRDVDAVIEHVGSTAVPGLVAKPIIDICVGLRSLQHAEDHVDSRCAPAQARCDACQRRRIRSAIDTIARLTTPSSAAHTIVVHSTWLPAIAVPTVQSAGRPPSKSTGCSLQERGRLVETKTVTLSCAEVPSPGCA